MQKSVVLCIMMHFAILPQSKFRCFCQLHLRTKQDKTKTTITKTFISHSCTSRQILIHFLGSLCYQFDINATIEHRSFVPDLTYHTIFKVHHAVV